jgi:hypothetical protein
MSDRSWRAMFVVAALWNAFIAAAILILPEWSYTQTYVTDAEGFTEAVRRLWMDFGLSVLIIGFGYYLVSRDLQRNHGLVIVGILAKLIVDVVGLTTRFFGGAARPLALFPAAVDLAFVILFALFLVRARKAPAPERAAPATVRAGH